MTSVPEEVGQLLESAEAARQRLLAVVLPGHEEEAEQCLENIVKATARITQWHTRSRMRKLLRVASRIDRLLDVNPQDTVALQSLRNKLRKIVNPDRSGKKPRPESQTPGTSATSPASAAGEQAQQPGKPAETETTESGFQKPRDNRPVTEIFSRLK